MPRQLKYTTILICFLFLSCSCNTESKTNNSTQESSYSALKSYTYYEVEKARGIAIIIHGLNIKPEPMLAIGKLCNDSGFSYVNVTLTGHDGNFDAFSNVTGMMWLEDLDAAYQFVQNSPELQDLPLVFIGFSTGGIVGTVYQDFADKQIFDGMIFFAPAIFLNPHTSLVRLLFKFDQSKTLKSMQPKSYRVYDGTTIAAYKALFDLVDRFDPDTSLLNHTPVITFVDPKDELINDKKLAAFHELNGTLYLLKRKSRDMKYSTHHLIIDETAVGHDLWPSIQTAVQQFLSSI